jgi:hypothetical protein
MTAPKDGTKYFIKLDLSFPLLEDHAVNLLDYKISDGGTPFSLRLQTVDTIFKIQVLNIIEKI